jgi:hypothetical protein
LEASLKGLFIIQPGSLFSSELPSMTEHIQLPKSSYPLLFTSLSLSININCFFFEIEHGQVLTASALIPYIQTRQLFLFGALPANEVCIAKV